MIQWIKRRIERVRFWLYGPAVEPRLPPELETQFRELDRQQKLLEDLVLKMRYRGLGWEDESRTRSPADRS